MKLPKLHHFTAIKNLLIAFLTIKSVMCFLLVFTGTTIIGANKEYPIEKGIVFSYRYTPTDDIKPEDTLVAKLSLVSANSTNYNNKLIGYEIVIRGVALFVLHQFGVYSVQIENLLQLSLLLILLIAWELILYFFLDIYTVFLVIDLIFIVFLFDYIFLIIFGLKPGPKPEEMVPNTDENVDDFVDEDTKIDIRQSTDM